MSPAAPDGQAVVLDVAQLQALLAKTFSVGLDDVGRGEEPVALVRLRLAKALIGVAEANALAAESIAIEQGVGTEQIAQTEALALHAAAFNGMPDPVVHLTARAIAIVTGLAAVEPDPRAGDNGVLLDAALQAATGLAQLLRFRGACATARSAAEREAATACLLNAEAELTKAAGAVSGLLELAEVSAAAGRTGASDLEALFEAALRGERSTVELRSLHSDRTLWTRVAPVIGADVPAGVAISVDITEHREAEEASRRLAAIVEQSGDAILAIDRDGTITAWNHGAERLFRYHAADATGRAILSLVPKERRDEERELLRQVLDGATISYESRRLRSDRTVIDVSVTASPIRDRQGTVIAVSAILRDVTESKHLEQSLRHLARHDPLTGLLNRGAFDAELERSIAFARRFESTAALALIDIDHFKYINDTFGHAVGDATLRRVAEILRTRLRETDVLARLGGDEFGLILAGTTAHASGAVADELLDAIRADTSIQLEENVVRLTASVGLTAIDPAEDVTAEDIVREADIAMYEAKESGRDRRVESVGGQASEPSSVARRGWSHRVRDALREDRFVLHQQPIVGLSSGRVERAELLIRMRNDDTELIAPGSFLPAAERFRQIGAIDHWVIGRAIERLHQTEAPRILHVNLSGMTISDPQLVTELPARIARESGDPSRLAFEITETAAIENIDTATQLAQRLSTLGCEIILDDFGSGFGSFYYLKHLPFAVIKIDGEFIKQLTTSKVDQVTVRSIVELAHGLEKATIAECVEDEATLQLVRQLGIDYAQGFHPGRPQDIIR